MESFAIVLAAVLLIAIWLVWMAWEHRRAADDQAKTVHRALVRNGATDIDVRRVSDAGAGLNAYETTYTDADGIRQRAACLVAGGHLFWSDIEPVRVTKLLGSSASK
jgi:hypothetical protein